MAFFVMGVNRSLLRSFLLCKSAAIYAKNFKNYARSKIWNCINIIRSLINVTFFRSPATITCFTKREFRENVSNRLHLVA